MLERFSISLEQELLAAFDRFLKKHSYSNRSEGIRDLIRKSLVSDEWDEDDEVVGVISLVFNHHQRQLQEKITQLQHNFHHMIGSTTHIHLDHDNCLEVVITKGPAKKIKQLVNQLSALRGVKNCSLSATSTGKHIH
jgi:CopG family transcriptional regulator, nickel-responsive regulator